MNFYVIYKPKCLLCQHCGLFVDAVSLLDFFTCIGHVDAEKMLLSTASSILASPPYMKRAWLLLYKICSPWSSANQGYDYSKFFPAIQDPDKWDNGSTGLKHLICQGMLGVDYQLETAIKSILSALPEAKQIAYECLYKAKYFVSELCNVIINDYHKWKRHGHAKCKAWKMTSISVQCVFEEIHSERVVNQEIYDKKSTKFTSAKCFMATWKAHVVMECYIKHQFYKHLAIAAELAQHLADNYVKPDDALTTRLSTLDKSHKALVVRVDALAAKDIDNTCAKNEKGKSNNAGGNTILSKSGCGTPSVHHLGLEPSPIPPLSCEWYYPTSLL
jgi:hypothetical protein